MARYLLHEAYGTRAFGEYEGATARDALAAYSVGQGFADPRDYDHGEDSVFLRDAEGVVFGMVFTNTQIIATAL